MIDSQQAKKYLTFLLNDKIYAINILKIKEILEYVEITPIPKMPIFVPGAINVRGKLIPVIDLNQCLCQEHSEINKRSCIVIIEVVYNNSSANIGLIVDAVNKVMDFKSVDIEQAQCFGESINTDFIEGLGKMDDQFIVMLNIDKIMSAEEFSKL